MKELIFLSAGNPGALTCLMGMMAPDNPENMLSGMTILPILKKYGITGTNIYVFWSDLCNKDYQVMEKLCNDVPQELLIDAASRQDYSGIKIIKPYL